MEIPESTSQKYTISRCYRYRAYKSRRSYSAAMASRNTTAHRSGHNTTAQSSGLSFDGKYIISKCEDMIKSFNPTTHSIDTHCSQLGDIDGPTAKPENTFIQQVVYGWYRERPVLDSFIKNLYADCSASCARTDKIFYTIFAYLCIFRFDELGIQKFKALAKSQDPTKISNLISYLYNKENLYSCLRAEWMKVVDLTYAEEFIIKNVEKNMSELLRYNEDLVGVAADIAAKLAASEEAKANGTAGLKSVEKMGLTRPISPKLTQQRPPKLPEPLRIENNVVAKEVPAFINKTNLVEIQSLKDAERETVRTYTIAKYSDSDQFTFHETKGGRKKEDVLREIEETTAKELQFDNTYVHEPPDFSKVSAKVRLNAATILREDFLYRKQQAKDVAILKNYEEELRDPVEYYAWQEEMKEQDHQTKLKNVVVRREQAKQSSIEAKIAIEQQREGNKVVAKLIRVQANAIKEQKELENEIAVLQNQLSAKEIIEARETKPKEAVQKVLQSKVETTKQIRSELEEQRKRKEEEDRIDEEIRTDKIRQLKALNSVHKRHVVVFDPTKSAGVGLLDEMSYMEMKERLDTKKLKDEEKEKDKRAEILERKQKKAKDLEARALSVMRSRQVKADATHVYIMKKKLAAEKEVEIKERAREIAAMKLQEEIIVHREVQQAEKVRLLEEEERVKRQQQYLGAAAGLVEEKRNREVELARRRQERLEQEEAKEKAILDKHVQVQYAKNKKVVETTIRSQKAAEVEEKERELAEEKRLAVIKAKKALQDKKQMAATIREQHEITKNVTILHNPYAYNITQESLAKVRTSASNSRN